MEFEADNDAWLIRCVSGDTTIYCDEQNDETCDFIQ